MPEPTAPHSSTTHPRPRPSANGTTASVPSEAAKARPRIRHVVAMLAMLAVPVVIFATPSPASAASSGRLCETSGSYCLGSDTLQVDQQVTEKSTGRNLTAVLQSGTFQGHAKYKLRFNGNTSLCVAGDPFGNVIINNCTGAGTLWAQDGSRWISVAATNSFGFGSDIYLCALNDGGAYQLQKLGQNGFFYRFSWK